ncbi:MAG: TetR/AcrR family transcriptional regulator [Pseudomonadota bacterium]
MTKSRWHSDLHWRRESQQTRGEKTQNALLDAAEELIVEKGVDGTSIGDVAKRAGSSVGSVYHHFKDKKALFYALFHRMTQAMAEQTRQAAEPTRWEGASVRDLLDGFLELRLQQRRLASVSKSAMALVMANDPDLKAHMAEIKLEGSIALRELILARRSEIGHPDPEFAVGFVIDQTNAMLYALSDPYQKKSALVDAHDDKFKTIVLAWAESALKLTDA